MNQFAEKILHFGFRHFSGGVGTHFTQHVVPFGVFQWVVQASAGHVGHAFNVGLDFVRGRVGDGEKDVPVQWIDNVLSGGGFVRRPPTTTAQVGPHRGVFGGHGIGVDGGPGWKRVLGGETTA